MRRRNNDDRNIIREAEALAANPGAMRARTARLLVFKFR